MGEENMKKKLAEAVRSIQWSYAIFWSPSPQQSGLLEWGDGYYNGGIKTRRTIQIMDIKADDHQTVSQRSDQLRELYLSFLSDDDNVNNHLSRRALAALSPEDLTDLEWFYLVCMTYVFNIGQGLIGRSLATGRTIWQSYAQCAHNQVFTRYLLAKSAGVKTVLCFPYRDGVIELGVTDLVKEDLNLFQHIRTYFSDNSPPPRHAFPQQVEGHDVELLSPRGSSNGGVPLTQTLADLDLFEGLDDVQENHNITSHGNNSPVLKGPMIANDVNLQENNGVQNCDKISKDLHYQNVLSSLFKNSNQGFQKQERFIKKSGFIRWKKGVNNENVGLSEVIPQCMLKKILFEVPLMHSAHTIMEGKEDSVRTNKVHKQEVFYTNHVLAERRRREKLSERFLTLRSLIPSRTKADKISILDDTITYVKELEIKVKEFESCQESTSSDVKKKKRKVNEIGEGSEINEGEQECAQLSTKDNLVDKTITITISMVDKEAFINLSCPWRESLLLQIIDAISNLHLDSQSVHSSNVDGILSLKIQSKVNGLTRVSVETITQTLLRVIRFG